MNRRHFLIASGAALLPRIAIAASDAILLRDLYNRDRSYSDLALSLEGQRVTLQGFMAPPLKADSDFFVLTKMPMAVCPFCESEAEWPDDIVAIYTKRTVQALPFNVRIEARGVLELSGYKDPDTGFFSKLRLSDATYG